VRLERGVARLYPVLALLAHDIEPQVIRLAQLVEAAPQELGHRRRLAGGEAEESKGLQSHGALYHAEVAVLSQALKKLQQARDVVADLGRRGGLQRMGRIAHAAIIAGLQRGKTGGSSS
jgi:hypothetical protein